MRVCVRPVRPKKAELLPALNCQIVQAYLSVADPEACKRRWRISQDHTAASEFKDDAEP